MSPPAPTNPPPLDPAAVVAALEARLGTLSTPQRQGAYFLLSRLAADPDLRDRRQWAYILATAWHETGQTLQPVREIGQGRGRAYGRPGRHQGQIAYGRGYVQLTWDDNYAKVDRELKLGGRLLANYDLALQPGLAYQILARGMARGWFTGQRLDDYINARGCDFRGARRIVNGQDRAALIAGQARVWWRALGAEPA